MLVFLFFRVLLCSLPIVASLVLASLLKGSAFGTRDLRRSPLAHDRRSGARHFSVLSVLGAGFQQIWPQRAQWCWCSVAQALEYPRARCLLGCSGALLALVPRSTLLSAKFTPLSPLGAALSAQLLGSAHSACPTQLSPHGSVHSAQPTRLSPHAQPPRSCAVSCGHPVLRSTTPPLEALRRPDRASSVAQPFWRTWAQPLQQF